MLEGKYSEKNVYLINPTDGQAMCAFHKIFVNGKTPKCPEKYGTAFQVYLDSCNLSLGNKVRIQILYEKGQRPKTLNPEVMK